MISDKNYPDSLPLASEEIPGGLFTTPPPSGQELIDTTRRLFKNWHRKKGRLNVLIGPSGPQRCSDDLLKRCASLSNDYDTVLHTHVLETYKQAEAGRTLYGKPMVLHMEEIGALSCKTSFAHCVWLTKSEVETAARNNVVIVHNPASNLRLGSGRAPICTYKKAGLKIALGTDGANASGSVNMFESMKLAAILHNPYETTPEHWIRPDEVLKMATLHSATAAGLDHETGSLEVGKKADIIVLNPNKSFSLNPLEQPLRQVIYGEFGNSVETVIIEGKIVVDDGVIKTFDEEKVIDEIEKRLERLQSRFQKTKGKVDEEAAFIRKVFLKAKKQEPEYYGTGQTGVK
jgi:cytosine/adenosine deaminase-related metal-dependent hydrolase